MGHSVRFSLIVISLLLGVSACSSPSILKGSEGIARYQQLDPKGDGLSLELVIVQESHPNSGDILSQNTKKSCAKIASNEEYADLLRRMVNEYDFLDLIEAAPSEKESRSSCMITVENELGRWALRGDHRWGDCTGVMGPDHFLEMVFLIKNTFNNIFFLQTVEEEGGVALFLREREKLKKYKP